MVPPYRLAAGRRAPGARSAGDLRPIRLGDGPFIRAAGAGAARRDFPEGRWNNPRARGSNGVMILPIADEPDAAPAPTPTEGDPAFEALCRRFVDDCRRGDRDGFRELVALTEPRIRRLIGRLASRGADLDDLVQETYLRAWRALGGFRSESRFSTWLFRIAVNVARTWRRDRRPTAPLPEDAEHSLRVAPAPDDASLLALYERALAGLPPDLRAVFVLHEAEGLSYRDVAETLGCPIGTVMSRLHRARSRLLEELRERLEELVP
jgi:RNA polymerase sigma-70 factor, ECF subfamily